MLVFLFLYFLKNLMPTTTDNNSILALLQIATKAKRGGGGHGVGKPGSRGGHPWTDAKGNVRYGAQPKGGHSGAAKPTAAKPQAAVRTGVGGGSGKPKVGELRAGYRIKPQTAAGKVSAHKRMLAEMDRALKTGTDPHGNKLDAKSLAQLHVLSIQLRTQLKGSVKKEIAEQAAEGLPFTVFKDVKGQYRWVSVSSSGFVDGDGETVSTKALTDDVARCDAAGEYGVLDWWHTHVVLGNCDFNAMHGKLLIESGTFNNSLVAQKFAHVIADKKFLPGVSLEFEHREPGPQVIRGRVYKSIYKRKRALLPAQIASNVASKLEVYETANSGQITKEVKRKMDAHKEQRLRELLGSELVDEFLMGTARSEKALEGMGISFKALSPVAAVAEPPVEVAAPEPAPVETTAQREVTINERGDLIANGQNLTNLPALVVNEAVTETETEDEPVEIDAATMFEGLAQAVADKVLAAQTATQATATKEVNDVIAAQTVALKENTGALNKVVTENVALKARLDALEGNLPAGVRARVTQQPGISAKQLAPEHAGIVTAEKNVDPYLAAADRMMQTIPRG